MHCTWSHKPHILFSKRHSSKEGCYKPKKVWWSSRDVTLERAVICFTWFRQPMFGKKLLSQGLQSPLHTLVWPKFAKLCNFLKTVVLGSLDWFVPPGQRMQLQGEVSGCDVKNVNEISSIDLFSVNTYLEVFLCLQALFQTSKLWSCVVDPRHLFFQWLLMIMQLL